MISFWGSFLILRCYSKQTQLALACNPSIVSGIRCVGKAAFRGDRLPSVQWGVGAALVLPYFFECYLPMHIQVPWERPEKNRPTVRVVVLTILKVSRCSECCYLGVM